jgi:hypothetical protein
MSFKPDISAASIANEALALVPAGTITGLDEPSLEARECKRFYNSVVAMLLDRYHWNLATKRGVLAAIDNERAGEWGYAYAKPTDMAYPVSLVSSDGIGYAGWMERDHSYYLGGRKLLMQAGGTLFSTIDGASLEYTSYDITEGDFTPRFKDLVVLWLASKIVHPITKDDRRAQALMQEAEYQTQRAIASDLNRNRPTYGNSPSETEFARGTGLDLTFYGTGYPLDPVANPANTGT